MKKLHKFTAIILILVFLPACMDMFFDSPEMKAALKSGDPEQCKLLISERNDGSLYYAEQWKCLRRMAEAKGDYNLCKTIGDSKTEEYCYWDVAEETGDGVICQIEAIDKDKCYAAAARFDNDLDDCGQIDSESERFSCISAAAAGLGEIEHCYDMTDEAQLRCIQNFAGENGAEHCDSIYLSDDEEAECIWMHGKEFSDCEIIKDKERYRNSYEECMSRSAIEAGKATVCMELTGADKQERCVKQVSRKHDDPNACERLTMEAKDKCFYEYGAYENEPKVCKKIVDEKMKAECLEAAE